jgi:pilus assembly protein CpaE
MSATVLRLPLAEAREEPALHDKTPDFDGIHPATGSANAGHLPSAREQVASDGSGITGRVVVFLHVSGGAGATTLAVNMATCLNQGPARKSCAILDLDLQFGSVASLLDVPRASTLQALIDEPGRLDRTGLDEMLMRHASELFVLPAPRIPLPLDALKPATAAAIIDAARARFRYTIIDLPVALGTWTDVVLSRATRIYLVTPMTVPAAHNLARFFFLLQQHDLHLPISIVVNRHAKQAKHSLITPAEFNAAIGRTVDHIIPEDFPIVQQAANQGTPAVTLAPKSLFARAVTDIVTSETGDAQVAKRGLFGLF